VWKCKKCEHNNWQKAKKCEYCGNGLRKESDNPALPEGGDDPTPNYIAIGLRALLELVEEGAKGVVAIIVWLLVMSAFIGVLFGLVKIVKYFWYL